MLSKSFNKELFESIYSESLQIMNECGGWGGCGWNADDERRYQQHMNDMRIKGRKCDEWLATIKKGDPNYEWYLDAARTRDINVTDTPDEVDAKLRKMAMERKAKVEAWRRKDLLQRNRRTYMDAHGYSAEKEKAKNRAMRLESEAKRLRSEADEKEKLAEKLWQEAGGRDFWKNFKLPKPNKDGEYIDA